jgi:hypothetical protein
VARHTVDARAIAVTAGEGRRNRLRGRRDGWRPSATLPPELWDPRLKLLQTSEPVLWLHSHWDLSATHDYVPPSISPAKTKARQLAWRVIRPCLDRYFREEQEVVAQLVRAVDLLAKRIDDLASNEQRLLGAVRADLQDLAAHVDSALEDLGGEA